MTGHSFVRCEAVKVSYRQTKDGMVIAFAIHPNDLPPELALAPVGTRVLLAVAEIVDESGEPTDTGECPECHKYSGKCPACHSKRPAPDRSDRAREAYAMKDKMQQAATRSGMLPKDMAFRRFVTAKLGRTGLVSEDMCAAYIRSNCVVSTRAEIANSERAYQAFLALETSYKQAVGLMAEPR